MAASIAIAKTTTALSAVNSRRHLCTKFASASLIHSLREFRPSPLVLAHNRTGNGYSLPINRARNSSDYLPEAKFYKVEAILRPSNVEPISLALLRIGVNGVTVSDATGYGAQGGAADCDFPPGSLYMKKKMEIVVIKDRVEEVIAAIIQEARTGEIGDGKIFLIPVADVIRVRTGERGEDAQKMTRGRTNMF